MSGCPALIPTVSSPQTSDLKVEWTKVSDTTLSMCVCVSEEREVLSSLGSADIKDLQFQQPQITFLRIMTPSRQLEDEKTTPKNRAEITGLMSLGILDMEEASAARSYYLRDLASRQRDSFCLPLFKWCNIVLESFLSVIL